MILAIKRRTGLDTGTLEVVRLFMGKERGSMIGMDKIGEVLRKPGKADNGF